MIVVIQQRGLLLGDYSEGSYSRSNLTRLAYNGANITRGLFRVLRRVGLLPWDNNQRSI